MAWAFDNAHTQVEFSAKHMMIATVRGRFTKFSGKIELNAENPEQSVVDVTIDVNSIETHEPRRDGHLRSADFLDVENFPNITFQSRRIDVPKGSQLDNFKVVGDLTIRGVKREVVLEVSNE